MVERLMRLEHKALNPDQDREEGLARTYVWIEEQYRSGWTLLQTLMRTPARVDGRDTFSVGGMKAGAGARIVGNG